MTEFSKLNPIRVLMISKALVTGIYQKKLEELAALPNIRLRVVVPPEWVENRVGVLPLTRMFTSGYEMVVEPMRFNGHHHVHYYPGLARQMRLFEPHLVHIDEEPYNIVAAHATMLARRVGAKTLFFTWQNLDRRYPPPFSLFERYCYHAASVALAGNADAIRVLRRKGFHKPVELIPQFGIDPHIFKPADTPTPRPDGPVIGYYGRLVPEKGIDTLIDAVAQLPNPPRVVIVGSGASRDDLQRQAQERGVGERFDFRGPIPSDQIPDLLRTLDLIVVPSRTRPNWKEQFGRVIIEALSCGVPVIGSDSGEIPNVIGDGGLVFPEGDAGALAKHLQHLLEDSTARAAFGVAGRQRVLDHYTQAQIAAETYQVYQRVLGIDAGER